MEIVNYSKTADVKILNSIEYPNDKSFFFYSAVIVPHLHSPVIEGYKKLKKKFSKYCLDWYFTHYSNKGEESGWIFSRDDQIIKSKKLKK